MNHQQVHQFLANPGVDWLIWSRNVPAASHMGGVWERQIRSARSILASLLKNHGTCLKDESLHTLMTEVEAIVNSRPLTVKTISDPQSLTPLSPSNLLAMKNRVMMPPPDSFVRLDLHSRSQWRRVQHLTDEFWSRWRKEFLSILQGRSKWTIKKRNFKINDTVLIQTDAARNSWPMGRILEINKDENNAVRSVKLLISKKGSSFTSPILEWPISKLVLLVDAENNMWFPNEEPKVIYQDVLASWGEPVEEAMWWRNVKLLNLWWRDIVF